MVIALPPMRNRWLTLEACQSVGRLDKLAAGCVARLDLVQLGSRLDPTPIALMEPPPHTLRIAGCHVDVEQARVVLAHVPTLLL